MTQLFEYNHEDMQCAYTKPAMDSYNLNKEWASLTSGLSEEEISDLKQSKDTLDNYEKIYSIVEYVSTLHEGMTTLEKKIQTNNPTMPQNMYRKCSANSQKNLFPEMESFLQAYYDLMDDCDGHPVWQRKLEEDLGGSVSFLGIQMEEALRDQVVSSSPAYERFDGEKQKYFK